MEEYLIFAKSIAFKAKEIMLKYFNNSDSSYKKDNTVVTKADKEINDYLIKRVKEIYKEHSVLGEEESFGKSDYVWVCDPIDGTAMYARGVPIYVFSLALVFKGEPLLGIVYDPILDDLYYAVKGKGAYKNDKLIKVNNINLDDKESIIHYDSHPSFEYNLIYVIEELSKRTYLVSIGSIIKAGILVADGKFNLALFPGTKNKNCDIAAIKVIVEEAGGQVTDLYGKDQRYDKDINGAVISNGINHDEIINLISNINIKKR